MPGLNNWLVTNLSLGQNNYQIPFEVDFDFVLPVDFCFETASDSAALDIANRYDNLYLCISGGLDSEYVASVLIRNKIRFTPVICLLDPSSVIEAWWAFHFCKQHNIEPVVFDYRNQVHVIVKAMLRHSLRFKSPFSMGFLPNAIADLITTGRLITGFGDLLHTSTSYQDPLGNIIEIDEHDYYFDVTHPEHPGAFFTYTPSVFFSMMHTIDRNVNSQVAKSKLYDLPFRPKIATRLKEHIPKSLVSLVSKYEKLQDYKCVKLDHDSIIALSIMNK